MSDSTTNLDQIQTSQAAKEVVANELFDATSPAAFGGRRAAATLALTWGYYGGRWAGLPVANGTLSLAASTTNYIVAARATGTVTVSTATTNWDETAQYAHLYMVGTDGTGIAWYEDHRAGNGGVVGNLVGAGLTRWTETYTDTSPHATRPLITLGASAVAADLDAGMLPKGAGAFVLNAAGGKRGEYAVDLQLGNDNPTDVAGGAHSFAAGYRSRATGENSVVLGGDGNNASGPNAAVLGGSLATASGYGSIAIGGGQSTAAGSFAFRGTADAEDSMAIGVGGRTNQTVGAFARAAKLLAPMDITLTVYGTTVNATPVALTSDAGSATSYNQMSTETINAGNNSLIVDGMVLARGAGNVATAKSWRFTAHLNRTASGGTVLVSAVTPTIVADSGETWSVAVSVSGNSIAIECTGEAATTVKWSALLRALQVVGWPT